MRREGNFAVISAGVSGGLRKGEVRKRFIGGGRGTTKGR